MASPRRRVAAPVDSGRVTEIVNSGKPAQLTAAARRLGAARARQRVLKVPQQYMTQAVEAMRSVGVRGTVRNLTGTKRRQVQ